VGFGEEALQGDIVFEVLRFGVGVVFGLAFGRGCV
jgi:hypothetical protein